MRVALWVWLCAGCNGFPAAIPIAQAERKAEKYPSYEAVGRTTIVTVDSQRWQVLPGALMAAPASVLQPVQGAPLVALRGDTRPFTALFQRSTNDNVLVAGEIR
jgi:hypothetical protein